jgi:DNA (cytosine-5)-methyltransferase 1
VHIDADRIEHELKVAGLFAGIGGLEEGFRRSGPTETALLCEIWGPARAVLSNRFGIEERDVAGDVAKLRSIPAVDVLTAGFPCTDLSQAGLMAGIDGGASGLVAHVFRLLRGAKRRRALPSWLVIENVPNMLSLDQGQAMRYLVSQLESMGMRWAYRVVDSRFTGVPQRRRRVLLVASTTEDPRAVLFADDAGERPSADYRDDAFGFYWTEGRGGLGWAQDAVPTLKGGSTIGIPSQPAVWIPGEKLGRRFLWPTSEDGEALQGFPRGWTEAADTGTINGPRWKLVGNAVTVGVAEWLGRRLRQPGDWTDSSELWDGPRSWPTAAWGDDGKVRRMEMSELPEHKPYTHLLDAVRRDAMRSMTERGTRGFHSRLTAGNLGRQPGFRDDVLEHLKFAESATARLRQDR